MLEAAASAVVTTARSMRFPSPCAEERARPDLGTTVSPSRESCKKVRVLMAKAIRIYEETLAIARRVGAQSDYVELIRAALDRVKKLLLADDPSL